LPSSKFKNRKSKSLFFENSESLDKNFYRQSRFASSNCKFCGMFSKLLKIEVGFRTFRIRRIKYISGQESETSVKWPTGDSKYPRDKFSQVEVVLGVSGVEQGKEIFGNFGVPVLRLHHVVLRTQPRTETAPRGQGTHLGTIFRTSF